ncbi:sigma-70 family RNA polymerase sigma factor [Stappia sp. BW2]|uniref:RNA polymerase sigma factor n=1 Tax=Stappia sp. BW2 TaxID=2592622 RepID=UPI0011DE7BE3|nr:sigma-70 family RNA polymerase sigma factor [Stappia sp. BW2]TYC64793.1 sigma-70 family RNA polymerase sigma factor [Stappia sp. BW2]
MACTKDDFTKDLQGEIPHLRRYARSLTRNPEAGDDLMQTSLEKALRHHASFHCGTELRRWLFTIARNAYRDERKWLARRGDHLPIEDWLEETQAQPAQEKHLELEDVTRGIAGLRPEDRNALELRVFSGLSTGQIAKQTGVAVGTVKSRLSRARHLLAAV